jgi:hypothetical protein
MAEGEFDVMGARWDHMYPASEVVAEIGRVAIAATLVDHELALVLDALKFPKSYEELIRLPGRVLREKLEARIAEYFESETQALVDEIMSIVRASLMARNSVVHSIWRLEDKQRHVEVGTLDAVRSEVELNQVIRERGAQMKWQTLDPKTSAAGPSTVEEISKVRIGLEQAEEWLTALRFRLPSALFVGKPAGARRVMDPKDM